MKRERPISVWMGDHWRNATVYPGGWRRVEGSNGRPIFLASTHDSSYDSGVGRSDESDSMARGARHPATTRMAGAVAISRS